MWFVDMSARDKGITLSDQWDSKVCLCTLCYMGILTNQIVSVYILIILIINNFKCLCLFKDDGHTVRSYVSIMIIDCGHTGKWVDVKLCLYSLLISSAGPFLNKRHTT